MDWRGWDPESRPESLAQGRQPSTLSLEDESKLRSSSNWTLTLNHSSLNPKPFHGFQHVDTSLIEDESKRRPSSN